ncbi:hypothetical protein [Leadbettera azotonutricia]|uniref:Uncharacterized protein n=1 Tax=Leadbettera azotonutricia (strain ATCC BAA-888 / DSM 13862 / ZAS-9) TaxID=545695 RepID=F5YBC7_LEAAZ|nr:hypothetical protein [Leadbettera azotonutricia]AEF83175.1 conserved hypothetical protein [Leadbettera azotonutricia ZAS-9]
MKKPITFHYIAAILSAFLALIPAKAAAEGAVLQDTASSGGITASTDLKLQVSTMPEAKAGITQSFTFPFLQGEGPLTQDNNIRLSVTAEATPISLNAIGEALWTPVAFLQVAGGGRLGSGWNINLFGKEIYGIGINHRGEDMGDGKHHREVISGEPFDSLMWRLYGGLALQFDLAAIIPGDWNHILFRAYNEGRYNVYNRAANGEPWVFENDQGRNRNGWTWYGAYVLGYQMPLSPVLDTIAFMVETDKNFYNNPKGAGWGDDLTRWIFSMLFNFTITPRFGLVLAIQVRTLNNYGTSDLENREGIYYQDLELSDKYGKQRLAFYRTALIMSYKLR